MPAVPSAGRDGPLRSAGGIGGFSLRFCRDNGQVVVEVTGHLDASTTSLLLDPLLDVIESQGNHSIAIDLDGVAFMDTSGLRAVVSVHRLLETRGGTLVMLRPTPTVRRLLESTGIDGVLTVVPGHDEAAGKASG